MLFHRIATRRGYVVRTSTFIGLAYVGLLMHGALDALLSYGMRPFLPFDAKWYYGDVIFVADPWVWIILGAGTVLGGPRRRWRRLVVGGVRICDGRGERLGVSSRPHPPERRVRACAGVAAVDRSEDGGHR